MVISTHRHKEIEANKPKMSNVLMLLNIMWMLLFGFKWPLLLRDSFSRTGFVRAVKLLSSGS